MADEPFSAACGPLPEGTLLGKYRIDGFTACSSTGELYSATEEKTNKRCSLLVISAAISGHSPDVAAHLLKKAEKACFFRHRNFAAVLGVFQTEEYRCIATELIHGQSIRELVEGGELNPDTAEKIIKQLAGLLAAGEKFQAPAFEFTPDDLFVSASGEVKYLYPGTGALSHLFSGATLLKMPRLRRNTLFTAPELLLGNAPYSFAAAVYSLGALYSYMLCKGEYFRSGNEYAVLAKLLKGEFPGAEIPGDTALLSHLLEKDPAARISSGRELLKLFGMKVPLFCTPYFRSALSLLFCLIAIVLVIFFLRRSSADHSKEGLGKLPQGAAVQTTPAPAEKKYSSQAVKRIRVRKQTSRKNSEPVISRRRSPTVRKNVSPGRTRPAESRIKDVAWKRSLKRQKAAFAGAVSPMQKNSRKSERYDAAEELVSGIRKNDLAQVQRAIARGADADAFLDGGITPLIAACQKKNTAMAELLIAKGADVNKCSKAGRFPLAETFPPGKEGSPELFELLLNKGALPVLRSGSRENLLSVLCHDFANHPESPRFAEIMLKSKKIRRDPRLLFHVCRPNNGALFSALVRHWGDFSGDEYKELYLVALNRKMPADVIRLMLERKVPVPRSEVLNELLLRLDEPAITALFPAVKSQSTLSSTAFKPVHFNNPHLAEKACKAIRRHSLGELEKTLEEGLSPDAAARNMTLLQHAAETDSFKAAELLLKKKADPFRSTAVNREIPVAMAVRNGSFRTFRLLVVKPFPQARFHDQVMEAILRRSNAYDYLELYLKHHSSELKNSSLCYLTVAMRYKASEKILVRLVNLYRDFSHAKHKAVIHQALMSGYKAGLIKALLDRNAQVQSKERSYLKSSQGWETYHLTPLQTARKAKSPNVIVRLLRKKGAR